MSTDLVRLPRQKFSLPKLDDFWGICDFASMEYSFFQAINIAIIEALIRYKDSSGKVAALKSQYEALLAQAKNISEQFTNGKVYMAIFSQLFDQMLALQSNSEESLKMCEDYTIKSNVDFNYSFFYSMFCIFLSLFKENTEIDTKIRQLDIFPIQNKLLDALVSKINVKISLHSAEGSEYFVSNTAREGPSIHIYSNDGKYSILYSKYLYIGPYLSSPVDHFTQEVPEALPNSGLPKLIIEVTKEDLERQFKDTFPPPKQASFNLPQINPVVDKPKQISNELPKIIPLEQKKDESTSVKSNNLPPKIMIHQEMVKLHQATDKSTLPGAVYPNDNRSIMPPTISPPSINPPIINPPKPASGVIAPPTSNIHPVPIITPPSNITTSRFTTTIAPPSDNYSSPNALNISNKFSSCAPDLSSNHLSNLNQIPFANPQKPEEMINTFQFGSNNELRQATFNDPNSYYSPGQPNNVTNEQLLQCSSCLSGYDMNYFGGFSCKCSICFNCRKQYHAHFCSFCGQPYSQHEMSIMQKHYNSNPRSHYSK